MKGIYIITHSESGKQYVGKDTRLGRRAKEHLGLKDPSCPAIHNAIKKHSADNFDVELIPYPNISHEALKAVEMWKIKQLKSHRSQGGYNLTWGGEGFDPKTAREIACRRVEEGTHNLLGSDANRKRIENGTHHFVCSDFQRKQNLKRIADGTHQFLDSEFQRRLAIKTSRKRIENGTHPFLRANHHNARPEYYQVYMEFILSLPLGIQQVRKILCKKFSDIPERTIYNWVAKWQSQDTE